MDRIFQHSYHVSGTLAANIGVYFTAPCDCQLLHVSAVASNDSDATLKIGNSGDDDAYLVAAVIGDSNTPVEFARSNFVGTQYPHISDGTVISFILDYDGSGGTAADDFTLVATFTEG